MVDRQAHRTGVTPFVAGEPVLGAVDGIGVAFQSEGSIIGSKEELSDVEQVIFSM